MHSMTAERFRVLWFTGPYHCVHLREALTAFIHAEAMRAKAEWTLAYVESRTSASDAESAWTDADWTRAAWERYLGRQP